MHASESPSAHLATATQHLGKRHFASDNYSGVHPEVMHALSTINTGHTPAYGGDPVTAELATLARELFTPDTEIYPVFNGTGANVTGLQAMLPRWGAVVCATTAHINVDEGGAPEKMAGLKLLTVPTADGKLTPELVDREAWGWGDEHRAQPLVVSITQSTEFGTCYSPDEIRALAAHAHERGMTLHLDGSRLGNAAAHLNTDLRALTVDCGVDVLSLGGTKNGLMGAEAVVAIRPDRAPGLTYLRKTHMQLGSKLRFVSAQLLELYGTELWRRSATHANTMAQRLSAGISHLATLPHSGVRLAQPTQSNAVFAELPPAVAAHAREQFTFYTWPGSDTMVRLMCSFDTTAADVDALLAAITAGVDAASATH